jgi:DNA helicase-2/ATP-dependent DNA helicase PcrA
MFPIAAHLQDLNPPQFEAVTTVDGPLLILAGAGSGKTRVLTRRVAHLLHLGVAPENVLAVTFTNRAAMEMRRRVHDLVGPTADRLLVSTFHSACARFLRRDAPLAGYTRSFTIYDTEDQTRLIRRVLEDAHLDPKTYPPAAFLTEIDRAKNRLETPRDAVCVRQQGLPLSEVWTRYEAALRAADAMDFNDLILVMVNLLEGEERIREAYLRRFRYILIDEYQDTNHAQYRLVRALTGPEENLAVVGDDDQSIYAFRGADIRNILSFEEDFPSAKVIRLEQNYRSTGRILRAANALVRCNRHRKEKTLWTAEEDGEPILRIEAEDAEDEASLILREIRSSLQGSWQPSDIAIIFRTNAGTLPFEKALALHGIPFALVGGQKFYERREIRDVVAYLRLLLNPMDDAAFLRVVNVPRRGVGEKAILAVLGRARAAGIPLLAAMRELLREENRPHKGLLSFRDLLDGLARGLGVMPLDELILRLLEDSGYGEELKKEDAQTGSDRKGNVDKLASEARVCWDAGRAEGDDEPFDLLRTFLDRASLAGQDDALPTEGGRLTLLTAHLAKGLEYPIVFVPSMVEGNFPHSRASHREADVEEERRLVYVAFTRARKRLCLGVIRRSLIPVEGRLIWKNAVPSRFLFDLPEEDLPPPTARHSRPLATPRRLSELKRSVPKPPSPGNPPCGTTLLPEDPSLLEVGVRVQDRVWGPGRIVERRGPEEDPRFTVQFDRFGKKDIRFRERRLAISRD